MLHILWLIIKWILILLGILLGLILLAVLIVLLVPVRYQAEGEKNEKGWRAKGGVTWLAHAVSVRGKAENGDVDLVIRLFGLTMEQYKAFFDRFRKKSKKTGSFAEKDKDDGLEISGEIDQEEAPPEAAPPEAEAPSEAEKPLIAEKPPNSRGKGEEAARKKGIRSLWKKIKGLFSKIMHFPQRIWAKIKKTALTIRSICGKIDQWKQFIKDSRVQAAIRLILGALKKLLKHAGPKKISGYVHFGMEDPASTGYVLAVLGATCPIHKNRVRIQPSFEEKILEGEIAVKGRVYGVILLKLVLEVYLNKNFKSLMKILQSIREGDKSPKQSGAAG